MKIGKEKINGKEVSITYGNDNSINVNIFNNKILMEVVGSLDSNLKELEKISGSKIYSRGNSIVIKGKKDGNEKVKDTSLQSINGILISRPLFIEYLS